MDFLTKYKKHTDERSALGVPPLALNVEEIKDLINSLKNGDKNQDELIQILKNRVNPGVDEAAKIKAEFLNEIINHDLKIDGISKFDAINILENYIVTGFFTCRNIRDRVKTLIIHNCKNL